MYSCVAQNEKDSLFSCKYSDITLHVSSGIMLSITEVLEIVGCLIKPLKHHILISFPGYNAF